MTGPPSFRYYAGTPLTTNKGINIGSLFILDTVVRPPLTVDQQSFLGSVAQIIMKHLEMSREAQERKKAMRMSRGLNAFVEGKSHLNDEEYLFGNSYAEHGEELGIGQTGFANSSRSGGRRRTRRQDGLASDAKSRQSKNESNISFAMIDGSSDIPATGPTHSHPVQVHRNSKLSTDQDTSQSESDADLSKENSEGGHKKTIARAAGLLRQSLDLRSGGGVVYFDTSVGFSGRANDEPTSPTMRDTAVNIDLEDENPTMVRRNSLVLNSTSLRHDGIDGDLEAPKSEKLADIISFSINRPVIGSQHEAQEPIPFTSLTEGSLQYLLRRYPRGKLWSFDEDGNLTSSEEEIGSTEKTSGHFHARTQRRQYIARTLQKHFPGGEALESR